MEHVTYTIRVSLSVVIGDIASSPSLYHLELLDISLSMMSQTVPTYSTRGLTKAKYACCLMVSSLETVDYVGFGTNVNHVAVPFKS